MPNTTHAKIHVLHLIGSTGLYGAERWILAQLRSSDAESIRFTVMNLTDAEEERSAVVAEARERGFQALDFNTRGRYSLSAVVRLAGWVKKNGVDVVHGHGFKSDVVGLLVARLAGCRIISTPHGWSCEPDRLLRMYERLDRLLFRFMDLVCPLSADLADGIRTMVKPDRLKLIMNGVDIDEVQSALPARTVEPGKFVVGYVGQLIGRKDLSTLVGGFRLLSQNHENLRLVIVGDGQKKQELQDEVQAQQLGPVTEFLGFRPDAAAHMKTFDVFVLTSLLEGIPRCIMEAMAAGVPVVVSDIPGNRNLVIHGETGLLFDTGDIRGLAEQLDFLITHPERSKKMASRAKAKVEAEYSSRKMAKDYGSLYHELVRGAATEPDGARSQDEKRQASVGV